MGAAVELEKVRLKKRSLFQGIFRARPRPDYGCYPRRSPLSSLRDKGRRARRRAAASGPPSAQATKRNRLTIGTSSPGAA